jgi:hypothetical protein
MNLFFSDGTHENARNGDFRRVETRAACESSGEAQIRYLMMLNDKHYHANVDR